MRGRVAIVLLVAVLTALTAGCLCIGPDDDTASKISITQDGNTPLISPAYTGHPVPEPSYKKENTTLTNYWQTDDGYYLSWSKTYTSNDPADAERMMAIAKMPIPTPDKVTGRIIYPTFIRFGQNR